MDDLGKSLPMAEGMVDAEQSGKPRRNNSHCLNCGTELMDVFCHHCGQKDLPKRQTLAELLTNFVSSFWSYEGKFLLTARYLITKPGFLAKEYNAGRRESYYHPARMYVFISFVFFLLFFSFSNDDASDNLVKFPDEKNTTEGQLDKIDSAINSVSGNDSTLHNALPGLGDSIRSVVKKNKKRNKINYSISATDYKSIHEYDSIQQSLPVEKRDGWFERKVNYRTIELNRKYQGNLGGFGKDFGKAYMDNFSKILFFLLPLFAVILKLLYIRKDYFYSEHLVFSIYYYNFVYLAGSLYILTNLIPPLRWLTTIIAIWMFVYLLIGMKRMYGQGWRKTIFKYVILAGSFFLCAAVGLAVNALFILLMI